MNYPNVVYVHIGLTKTSTSYLQTKIFSKIKDKNLIYNHQIFFEMIDLINLIDYNSVDFNNIKVKIFREKINKFLQENSQKIIFFSSETCTGNKYGLTNFNERMFLLNYFIPNAKIILFLREHKSWIISQYRQSIQQGNFQSFDDFIYFGDKEVSDNNTYESGILPKLNIKNISYKKIITIIEKYFGKGNLSIFKYENFKLDYKSYLLILMNLITSPEHTEEIVNSLKSNEINYRGLSGLSIKIILLMNYFLMPVVKKMNYNYSRKLFNFTNQINYDSNILLKMFCWKNIRILFQNLLDKLIYLDLNLIKKAEKKLEKYQNFFDIDDYENLFK